MISEDVNPQSLPVSGGFYGKRSWPAGEHIYVTEMISSGVSSLQLQPKLFSCALEVSECPSPSLPKGVFEYR